MENTILRKSETHKSSGLSGTTIKLLALCLMLLDHIHYFFEFTDTIPIWFSLLGRSSAWIFLFITVEGFAHTSNRKKYFVRIWLMGAAMGTVNRLIELFLLRGDGFYPQNNIFATLTVLLVFWQGIEWLRQKNFIKGLSALVVPFALLAGFAKLPLNIMPFAYLLVQTFVPLPLLTEGGMLLLLCGMALFLFRKKIKLQVFAWTISILAFNIYVGIMSGIPFGMQWITYNNEWMGVFAAIPMLMYNGEKGRGLKQLFYIFYPAHVYILWGLSLLVYTWLK